MIRNVFAVFFQSPDGVLHDEAGDLGGAAVPTPSAAPAPAATPTPVATAPLAATPPAPQAPATPGAPEGWVPSYRIRETREAAAREAQQTYSTQLQAAQEEINKYKNLIRAQIGDTAPPNQEHAAVRDQFGRLYPGLAKLEERAEQLEQLIERAGDLEQQNSHYWQNYGRVTMDRLFDHASKSLGSPLTDEGKRQLHSAFVGFVGSSPELTSRYTTDPTLVEEFWQAFTSSFVEPARRAAATTVQQRAAGIGLPQDRGGAAPPVTPGPKPANLDERAAQAWAKYQQDARQ